MKKKSHPEADKIREETQCEVFQSLSIAMQERVLEQLDSAIYHIIAFGGEVLEKNNYDAILKELKNRKTLL